MAVCNDHDQIKLKLNDFMLQQRPANETNDFLYFLHGELIGFLGLYQFNAQEVEISGMVHPAHRRKGHFSTLLEAAKIEIARRNIPKLIFINAETSPTGKLILESHGAKYSFSEYWMALTKTRVPNMQHPLQLRSTDTPDIPFVAHAMAIGFQMNESETLELMTIDPNGTEKNSYRKVIELSGTSIGTISINQPDETSAFIYGFVILPEYQRRGYGRQALALAIQTAQDSGCTTIELEVACENKNALSLYQSCGFEVQRANDYYVFHMVNI